MQGFELPNGRVLRLFHASNKRNWRSPPQEPVEPLPAALTTLGLAGLPPHPPPPQPSRRDVQKLTQPDLRAAKFTALDLRKALVFQVGMMRDAGCASTAHTVPTLATAAAHSSPTLRRRTPHAVCTAGTHVPR